ILTGSRILRVLPGPECAPMSWVGATLARTRPRALALSGALPRDTVAWWLSNAAELGIPCFWDVPGQADLDVIGPGAAVLLQASYAAHAPQYEGLTPCELARELLVRTGAAGVIVTAAERGAFGILRDDRRVLHAPAVFLENPQSLVGCGDAHLAGFLTTFL